MSEEMSEDVGLPEAVMHFVLRYLESVAELEGLLLMRIERSHTWNGSRLAARLYITDRAAEEVLDALHRHALLARVGDEFRYQPESAALEAAVDSVAASYPKFLLPITHLIHSKPRAALREFADAFKLRENT
jgi:hypothetical protein